MEPAGIAFAVVGTADLCLKYGRELRDRYRSYKHAEQEIEEAILILEAHWNKIEEKVKILRKIWTTIEESLQQHQDKVLHVLRDKLQNGVLRINGLQEVPEYEPSVKSLHINGVGKRARARYAASVKESLRTINTELEKWQSTFDPSFFLISRISTADIDWQLSSQAAHSKDISVLKHLRDVHRRNAKPLDTSTSIFISESNLQGDRVCLPYSQAVFVSDSRRHAIIDTVLLKVPSNQDEEVRDVRNLARTLREVDPQIFGLLDCRGVVRRFDPYGTLTHFDVVFNVPTGLDKQPTNLRSLILAQDTRPTLDGRFQLAKSMARSVAYVHTCNFVHKNIRPDTVIVFPHATSIIGPSFLVGFEMFRPAGGRTYLVGDMLWEKNLYRHPRRQGMKPEEDYKMQHDIYSLGVCLLEIGLWSSFVVPNPDGARAGDVLDISDLLSVKDQTSKALKIKAVMANMATTRLPSYMGNRYTEVVMRCLTCLDKDNGFGDEADFRDEDGIKVGVRYIEKVLGELEQISL